MPEKTNSTKNVVFSFLAWLLPLAMTVIVTPLVVGALGPADYGVLALVLGITASMIGLLSPTRAFVRHIATQPEEDLEGAGRLLATAAMVAALVGLLVAFALAMNARWIVVHVLRIEAERQDLAWLALVIAVMVVPLAMASHTFSAATQGLQRFDLNGRLVFGLAILLLGGNGVLAVAGVGLLPLVGWSVVVAAASCLAFLVLARRLIPSVKLGWPLHLSALLPHLGFSGGVLASQAPGHLLLLFERAWIVRILGAPALAFYTIPMMIGISLHAGIASMALVFFPMASEAFAKKDLRRLREIYSRALKFAAALIAPAVVSLVVAGEQLLGLWLGPEFAEHSSQALSMHALAFGILAFVIVPWHLAEAFGRPSWNAVLAILWMAINAGLLIWFTPRFGIVGAAAARLASMSLVPFYGAFLERQLFGEIRWSFWARLLCILGLAAGVAGALQSWVLGLLAQSWLSLGLAVLLGGLCFFATLWVCRYFSVSERLWLRSRIAGLFARSL